MIDMITFTGNWKDVDRDIRDFIDNYGSRVIEIRYKVKMDSPQRLTVEIVYRTFGSNGRFSC